MNATRNRTLRGLHWGAITATVPLLFAAITAWGQEVVIKRPPCEIVITAVGPFFHGTNPSADGTPESDQSRADVARVKAALEKALEQSEDMRTKVDDACKKQENKIQILVFRDTTIVNYGHVEFGIIRLDMGDIDNVGDTLLGSQEATDIVADSKLTRTLAHEIDHLRHTDDENHKDPQGEAAGLTRGPAVDDENTVIAQMDVPFHTRTFYSAWSDGIGVSGYSVDTDGDGKADTSVTWFPGRPTRIARRAGGGQTDYFSIDPDAFKSIPLVVGSIFEQLNTTEPVTFGVQSGVNLDRAVDTVESLGGSISNYYRVPPFISAGFEQNLANLELGAEPDTPIGTGPIPISAAQYYLQVSAQPPTGAAAEKAFHIGLEDLQRLDVIGGYQMDYCREWLPRIPGLLERLRAPLWEWDTPGVTISGRAPAGTVVGSFDSAPDFSVPSVSSWRSSDSMGPNIVRVGESGQFTLQGSLPCGDIVVAHGWNRIPIPCESPAPGLGAPAVAGVAQGGDAGQSIFGDVRGELSTVVTAPVILSLSSTPTTDTPVRGTAARAAQGGGAGDAGGFPSDEQRALADLPRLGQQVVADFLSGDPDRPTVGAIYNRLGIWMPYSRTEWLDIINFILRGQDDDIDIESPFAEYKNIDIAIPNRGAACVGSGCPDSLTVTCGPAGCPAQGFAYACEGECPQNIDYYCEADCADSLSLTCGPDPGGCPTNFGLSCGLGGCPSEVVIDCGPSGCGPNVDMSCGAGACTVDPLPACDLGSGTCPYGGEQPYLGWNTGGDAAGAGQELTAGEKQFPNVGDFFIQSFALAFGGDSDATAPTGRGDHISDASLKAVTHGEETVAGEVRDGLGTFTTNSSVAINDFLRASYDYRQTYSLIQSASTGLQREVAVWEAGKAGMEKADFAIAIVQIVGGVSKVGVKVAHWYQLRKAVPKTPPVPAAGAVVGGTGASGRPATQVVGQSQTQAMTFYGDLGRGVPGRAPTQVVGQSGTQVASAAGRTPTQVIGQSATQVTGVRPVPRGGGGGPLSSGAATRGSSATGGGGFLQGPAPQMIQRAVDVEAEIGPYMAKAAQEAGVDAEAIIRGSGGFAQTALNRVMNAIAAARGWHELPIGLESAAQSILATIKRANAGDEIAIAALKSEGMAYQLQILRNFAQNQPDFYNWLRKAASGFDDLNWDIALLFNEDAIKLLKLVTENGFNLKSIRALLGSADAGRRVTQGGISLGAILGFSGASLSAGNFLTRDGSAAGGAAPQFGAGSSERDALARQAAAIYGSQNVALGDVRQAMGGIWNRLDQGQGFAHIIGGEMWNWFMSPTTTYFNWWQDVKLSGEYLDLVTNYGQEFVDLTGYLTASIQSLRALQNAFNEAGITADSAVLGGGGINRLQSLLLEIDNSFATATQVWRVTHVGEYLALRTLILEDIASLEAMNEGFREFLARLPNLIQWLDQLRMNAATGMRTAVQVFNPDIYVRLASVGLYLKVLASQGLLLDASNPLEVKPHDDDEWLSMTPDELKQRFRALPQGESLEYPVQTWPRFSPEQRAAIQEVGRERHAANIERMDQLDSGVEQGPGDDQSYQDFLDSLQPTGN